MKIKHYCAYQERCHTDVKEKLYTMGLSKSSVEQIISKLIEEDYLNEERFARLFASGHFRQKKWGINKIVYALKQKKVSEYNIKRAIKEIDPLEYLSVAEKIGQSKWDSLKGEQYIARENKTKLYLQQKGYELGLIQSIIQKIRHNPES